jgi:hypothetical protein
MPSGSLRALGWPELDTAVAYFMTSYAPNSPFFYLPTLFASSSLSSAGPGATAIQACSLASLSHHQNDDARLLTLARSCYAAAITDTNAALACSASAVLDSTLISVLLLSLFEIFILPSRPSPSHWSTHAQGATALLQLRGREQFSRPLGRVLYLHTSHNVRISCLQRGEPLPDGLVDLHLVAETVFEQHNPGLEMARVLDEAMELRIMGKVHASDSVNLVQRAMKLDRHAAAVENRLKAFQDCGFKAGGPVGQGTRKRETQERPNIRSARMQNSLRMVRLTANEMAWDEAEKLRTTGDLHPRTTNGSPLSESSSHSLPSLSSVPATTAMPLEYMESSCADLMTYLDNVQEKAVANVADCSTAILGSVPSSARTDCPDIMTRLESRFLIWPVAMAAVSKLSPLSTRSGALERLHQLSRDAKAPHAMQVAMTATKVKDTAEW